MRYLHVIGHESVLLQQGMSLPSSQPRSNKTVCKYTHQQHEEKTIRKRRNYLVSLVLNNAFGLDRQTLIAKANITKATKDFMTTATTGERGSYLATIEKCKWKRTPECR